jgi:hypothetical protein
MVTLRDPKRLAPILAGIAVLAAGYAWYSRLSPVSQPAASAAGSGAPGKAEGDLPRIDLARLEGPRPTAPLGKRDIFDFGVPPAPPEPPAPPPSEMEARNEPPPPVTVPTPPPPPPLNIKYIGALEDKRGLKVAMFLNERKEVLTGQPGQLVGNRFRVVRIGVESVDIQELGSEQTRRIPLKGN